MTLWGGRFQGPTDPLFKQFNDSLRFDHRLVEQDIAGSIAWAEALVGAGVLTGPERDLIRAALVEIAALAASDPHAVAQSGEEDVHSWVEARLIERLGSLGKKLHTGRSRNDQVATDLRLFARAQVAARIDEIRAAQAALVSLAERESGVVIPGYTHLQRAQPVLLAHWCLAYFEMLDRDAGRFADAARRASVCPLGSGALAGTSFPIDRAALAASLGFERASANSLDAVSDRDFIVELLAAASLCALHLSRLAEDLILYSSGEFALVELGDSVTSGSSLMPQKKNPDALELIRGKAGRILGAHVAISTTLKGLPLAYNKDLQEDKEPFFDAMDQLSLCLRVLPPVLESVKASRGACLSAARGGHSNATELADYLVGKGVPFREAHEITGRIVRFAIEQRRPLEELPISDLRRFSDRIDEGVYPRLSIDALLARRDVEGGTAPARVAAAVGEARRRLRAPDGP